MLTSDANNMLSFTIADKSDQYISQFPVVSTSFKFQTYFISLYCLFLTYCLQFWDNSNLYITSKLLKSMFFNFV